MGRGTIWPSRVFGGAFHKVKKTARKRIRMDGMTMNATFRALLLRFRPFFFPLAIEN
jgi:hypothetical protein